MPPAWSFQGHSSVILYLALNTVSRTKYGSAILPRTVFFTSRATSKGYGTLEYVARIRKYWKVFLALALE